jgi:hypothetical protein
MTHHTPLPWIVNGRRHQMTYDPDYEAWLESFDEQPCEHCFEDNAHCVCQMLDAENEGWPVLTDADLVGWSETTVEEV